MTTIIALAGVGLAAPVELELHRAILPARTGVREEDYWTQLEVYGHVTNSSDQTLETVSGTVVFLDREGDLLDVDSIGTAVKADVGDLSPGETVLGEVHFVAPGQTVPFHFVRNLAAIDGEVASVRLHPRSGTPVEVAPRAVATAVAESSEGEGFLRRRVITATIRNEGAGSCRSPSLVIGVYDPAGQLASLESIDATDDLQHLVGTGESVAVRGSFTVAGDDAWRASAPIRTWVDCRPIW